MVPLSSKNIFEDRSVSMLIYLLHIILDYHPQVNGGTSVVHMFLKRNIQSTSFHIIYHNLSIARHYND